MKKLFYLLFISFVLASCTKEGDDAEPVEVVCTCDGATNGTGTSSTSSNIDPNLIGHWKVSGLSSSSSSDNGWDNGQIDLHFFSDGTWDIDGFTGLSSYPQASGTYKIHSNNCIDLGDRVMNYSINNDLLTFSAVPGQNDIKWIIHSDGDIVFGQYLYSYTVEINNLTKQ